jgi:transcriptional regulator with XRE-family HTH domain
VLAIFNVAKKLLRKLQRPAYRHAYVAEHVRRGIAYQIRALRDQRSWNQGTFSKRLDKPQSVVSRLEDPSYGKVTVQTLLEIAAVFDVALEVRFVSYSSFVQRTRDVSTPSMRVPEFKDDLGMRPPVDRKPIEIPWLQTGASNDENEIEVDYFPIREGSEDPVYVN